MQPNITTKSLQTVAYRGRDELWIAGRGGSILKRSDILSTFKTTRGQKLPPILKFGGKNPKPRTPLLTIADDGDIPIAAPPKKEKDN